MWGYYWGYTSAQIDLLVADCPVTVYEDIKKKKTPSKPRREYVDLLRQKWAKKYANGVNGVTIDLSGYNITK